MYLRKQADMKGLPNAYFHSAHILRDSKALFIATLSYGWEGAASASEHVCAWITKYKYKMIYKDSVKSNLLFSNAGCRISGAYIFRLFKYVPYRAPKAHRASVN